MQYEQEPGDVKMKFTTQSWLISLFYDCPKGLGIHCPSDVPCSISMVIARRVLST